jgi:hypothetical protein
MAAEWQSVDANTDHAQGRKAMCGEKRSAVRSGVRVAEAEAEAEAEGKW